MLTATFSSEVLICISPMRCQNGDKAGIPLVLLNAAGPVSVTGKNVCSGVGLPSGQKFGEDRAKTILQVNACCQTETSLRMQAFLQLDGVSRSRPPLHALEEGTVCIIGQINGLLFAPESSLERNFSLINICPEAFTMNRPYSFVFSVQQTFGRIFIW